MPGWLMWLPLPQLLGYICKSGEHRGHECHLPGVLQNVSIGESAWARIAFVLGNCGHHLSTVILQLFFLTLWSGCSVWRGRESSGSSHSQSSIGKEHVYRFRSQGPKLAYKGAIGVCAYLLLLNWGVAGWAFLLGCVRGWSKFPIAVGAAAVTQGTAWSVMAILARNASFASKERYPGILRAWWIVTFFWEVLGIAGYYVVPHDNSFVSLMGFWDITSCIGAAYLFILAVRGRTGLGAVDHDSYQPLLNGQRYEKVVSKQKVTEFGTAGFFSLATISWIHPLLIQGRRKALELKDVPLLVPADRAEASYASFKANWDKMKVEEPSKSPSLTTALFKTFWRKALWNGAFAAVNSCAIYVGPYFIVDFVDYLGGKRRFAYEGYILVGCLFGSKLVETLSQRQWQFGTSVLGLHVRSALTAIVYRKGLRLSSQSRLSHTSGEIINYMAVDVDRIGGFSWYLHDAWVLPLQVLLALAILYKSVGLATIATVLATIVILLINQPVAILYEKYQGNLMDAQDERMKSLSEALRSMKILKLQAWETTYLAKLEFLRGVEYRWLAKAVYASAASTFIFWTAPMLVASTTFGTCLLFNIPLTAGRILSALATFRALQSPLDAFPEFITLLVQASVSLDRLKNFLQEEELPPKDVIRMPCGEDAGGLEVQSAIEVEGGVFSWNPSAEVPTLRYINMTITKGARVAVCGTVGSGKSSILSCVLGEIPKIAGTVRVCGTTAYVAQSPWIQSGTIEDNIRFGLPMDYTKYRDVLRVCALEKDLELLAFGDQTQIGERGINLSGGQKQRIQLARAVYQDADVYLLDDPFSAVDAHTGSYLFKECILTKLASKTVMFITHQVEFLPAADLIMVLRNGEVVQAGRYEDLLHAGTDFSSLVCAHNEALESMDINGYVGYDNGVKDLADYLDELDGDGNSDELSIRGSDQTVNEYTDKHPNVAEVFQRQLVEDEQRERGNVDLSVYLSYLTAVSHGAYIPVIILLQSLFQMLQIGSNYWMAWGTPTTEGGERKANNATLILVYMSLSSGSTVFVFCRAMLVSFVGLLTSQKYFLDMLRCVFRAPMAFFDSTPAGRILSRASSDQNVMDLNIQFRFSGLMVSSIQLVGIIGVMSQVTWQVLLVFIPMVTVCIWIQRYYMTSARELARLVALQKSPIIHHYAESIAGAATIRGFDQEQRFMRTSLILFDRYARPFFHNSAANEWLIIRLEMLSTFVFAFSMIIIITLPAGMIEPSMAGLAVTYGLQLNYMQARWVWSLCNVENKIISVERIQQFTKIPSEAPAIIEGSRPERNWPARGTIQLQDLQIRYSDHSPLVLHGLTCTFPGGKKIGVVGRTGSGKSTLIHALFRLVEPVMGTILIDGLDISTIGLHDLRSRLSIIPQDPTLFEGHVRGNLDPLDEHSDSEIWEVLDKCQIGDVVRAKEGKLGALVSENGENWSVGQRQLFCLGRALLKRTRVLVLDEATASVDSATDGVIQRTLRNEFSACTVITVAHRIPTVVDSDYVLVLSDGRIVEYDTPVRLLEEKSSFFSKLVKEYTTRSCRVSDLTAIGRSQSYATSSRAKCQL